MIKGLDVSTNICRTVHRSNIDWMPFQWPPVTPMDASRS